VSLLQYEVGGTSFRLQDQNFACIAVQNAQVILLSIMWLLQSCLVQWSSESAILLPLIQVFVTTGHTC